MSIDTVVQLDDLPPALTISEAAAVLRISRNSAYELARLGELPTVRLGRRLIVPAAALKRILGGTNE